MIREYIDFDPSNYQLDGRLERHFNVTLKNDLGELLKGKKFHECTVDCDGGVIWFRNFSSESSAITEGYSAVISLKITNLTKTRK